MSRFYIPGVPAGTEPEELQRLEMLVADLRAYCDGNDPSEHEILAAPCVSDWHSVFDRHSYRLVGRVDGHPSVGPGPGITSRVFAAGTDGRWMRSWSRLWRLGPPTGRAGRRN